MKVAIAGYGQEGEVNLAYWQALGAEVEVFDQKEPTKKVPTGVQTHFGEDAFLKMNGFDLVIRTAGLNPHHIQTDGKIWSGTNEFFAKCPAPIIGVTGTKGKGTTCTLVAKILEAAGKKVHLLGNIGVPALGELSKIQLSDVVVFELSSFQLWDLEKSPTVAVVLRVEPDHLDVHASFEEYVTAKANIAKWQKPDDLIVYFSKTYSTQIAEQSPARKKQYLTPSGAYTLYALQSKTQPEKFGWIPEQYKDDPDEWIAIDEQLICKVKEVGLLGRHNLENICAAITAAWEFTRDVRAITAAVGQFTGLPHRLEFVRELAGVKFYDDSFSTGPGPTLAALQSFNNVPVTIILGGSDKGLSMSSVLSQLDPKLHELVLVGAVASKLETQCILLGFKNYINLGENPSMEEIVSQAQSVTPEGGIVLLSPGHASFGMFKSYYDRGDQFKAIVNTL